MDSAQSFSDQVINVATVHILSGPHGLRIQTSELLEPNPDSVSDNRRAEFQGLLTASLILNRNGSSAGALETIEQIDHFTSFVFKQPNMSNIF